MVEKLNEKGSEVAIDEATASVFKEVLGFRFGYAQGLGRSVIPEPSPSMQKNKAFVRMSEKNKKNKTCADIYRTQLETLMDVMRKYFFEDGMRNDFSEYGKQMDFHMSESDSNESQRETQGDAYPSLHLGIFLDGWGFFCILYKPSGHDSE